MSENSSTPAPAQQGQNPSGQGGTPSGAPPQQADIAKIIRDTLTTTLAERDAAWNERLEKMSADHKAEIARLKKQKGGGEGEQQGNQQAPQIPDEIRAELESSKAKQTELSNKLAQIEAEKKAAQIDARLTSTIAAHGGLIPDATKFIRDALRPYLEVSQTGEVIVKRDGKVQMLADAVSEYASQPFLQLPNNRGGGGRPPERSPGGKETKKTVSAYDTKALRDNFDGIADGSVIVTRD